VNKKWTVSELCSQNNQPGLRTTTAMEFLNAAQTVVLPCNQSKYLLHLTGLYVPNLDSRKEDSDSGGHGNHLPEPMRKRNNFFFGQNSSLPDSIGLLDSPLPSLHSSPLPSPPLLYSPLPSCCASDRLFCYCCTRVIE
jgi:hypothetical protein